MTELSKADLLSMFHVDDCKWHVYKAKNGKICAQPDTHRGRYNARKAVENGGMKIGEAVGVSKSQAMHAAKAIASK